MAPQENRITCSHKKKTSVTTNRAQQGVNRKQSLTVTYQQASAVPKPPAAVLASQHEGEGLTAVQNKCI